MTLACFAPHLASAFVLLALLAVACRHAGFGLCRRCDSNRSPRCACPGGDPHDRVRRMRWPTMKR